ncbi:hypothetical protein HDU76_000190 [Blyttiomyces sp. JEL0837]|nr:hypothetical protein HDU76_000190 [Blyttiomyces sp. JEL0837]
MDTSSSQPAQSLATETQASTSLDHTQPSQQPRSVRRNRNPWAVQDDEQLETESTIEGDSERGAPRALTSMTAMTREEVWEEVFDEMDDEIWSGVKIDFVKRRPHINNISLPEIIGILLRRGVIIRPGHPSCASWPSSVFPVSHFSWSWGPHRESDEESENSDENDNQEGDDDGADASANANADAGRERGRRRRAGGGSNHDNNGDGVEDIMLARERQGRSKVPSVAKMDFSGFSEAVRKLAKEIPKRDVSWLKRLLISTQPLHSPRSVPEGCGKWMASYISAEQDSTREKITRVELTSITWSFQHPISRGIARFHSDGTWTSDLWDHPEWWRIRRDGRPQVNFFPPLTPIRRADDWGFELVSEICKYVSLPGPPPPSLGMNHFTDL